MTGEEYGDWLQRLKRLLKRFGTLAAMAEALGKKDRFWYNLMNRRGRIDIEAFFELGKLINTPPHVVLQLTLPESLKDRSEQILFLLREQRDLPKNRFLDDLTPRLQDLQTRKVDPGAAVDSQVARIVALEELRFGNRDQAQAEAERLILRSVEALEQRGHWLPGPTLGEMAALIALWATIQRTRGFRDLAIKAFLQAFPLARFALDFWAEGCCFQRSAFVLSDLGRRDLGHLFSVKAQACFASTAAQLEGWKCMVDRGTLLVGAGELDEAERFLQGALRLLPGLEWRNRAAALQALGTVARKRGLPEKAKHWLELALKECQQQDSVQAHIHWSLALTEFEHGQAERSKRSFEQAEALLARFGSAGDVAMICLDHCEVLLKLGQPNQMISLIADTLAWLPKLCANPILCRTFTEFLDLARAVRIGPEQLAETRVAVKKAWALGEKKPA